MCTLLPPALLVFIRFLLPNLANVNRNYYFLAADQAELNEWVGILTDAIAAAREEKERTSQKKKPSSDDGAKSTKNKVKVNDFEALKLIGRGSFGKVVLNTRFPFFCPSFFLFIIQN